MKRILLFLTLIFIATSGYANLLYDITDGKFRAKSPAALRSMNDGEHYTQLNDGKAIVKCSYKTGQVVDTLFSVSRLKDAPFKTISGYEFSPNELKILLYNNRKQRYRRSFTADYYVYDIKRNELLPLSEYGQQEAPLFSPDSRYVAFARDNNLFIRKLDFNTELAVTKDGEYGKIINGIADWVYEEEFEKVRYFSWSPDSKLLAFVKFDETDVPEFAFQTFNNKKNDNQLPLYPDLFQYKYPKAGESNSKVSVYVYDDFYKTTKLIELDNTVDDFYIPRIVWTNSAEQLAVFRLNRNQNQLDMFLANPKSTVSKRILREVDQRYVDFQQIDYMRFFADNSGFIWVSEKDGYRHIYEYGINGTQKKQLTKGNWDVTNVYGYDEAKKIVYYQSAETSPMSRDVYTVDTKGKKTRLTDGKGMHNVAFSKTFAYFTDNVSTLNSPNIITLYSQRGKIRTLEDNAKLKKEFQSLQLPEKEFFSFKTSENIQLNGWILKPKKMDTGKKYPVLMVQYSGPNSQQVMDSWNIGWEYYLVTQGYIVACVDGRGTGARGSEFRKCTYQQMGVLEARDQVETAKYLGKQQFVDETRMGIFGWSYGGSMTLWAMSSGEKIFKAGIAVAPVVDWKLYDTAYTERFMRRPQENFNGYEKTSAINMAEKLNGELLIIHGTSDDNVHAQNTFLYTQRLNELNKPYEMHLYADKEHSLLGAQTRRHLYTRMCKFLFNNL